MCPGAALCHLLTPPRTRVFKISNRRVISFTAITCVIRVKVFLFYFIDKTFASTVATALYVTCLILYFVKSNSNIIILIYLIISVPQVATKCLEILEGNISNYFLKSITDGNIFLIFECENHYA